MQHAWPGLSVCLPVLVLLNRVHHGALGGQPRDLYLMGILPMTGDRWPAGDAQLLAINMALETINKRTGLLDDYRMNVLVEDSRVSVYVTC